jgi:hypothetical protein
MKSILNNNLSLIFREFSFLMGIFMGESSMGLGIETKTIWQIFTKTDKQSPTTSFELPSDFPAANPQWVCLSHWSTL